MITKKRSKKLSITQLSTDTSSDAIYVGAWDFAVVTTSLTTGTGNCVYKYQVAYERGGTKYDLLISGSATITRTATGDYADVVELGAAEELYITTTAIGTYDLDADIFAYNKGNNE